MPAICQAANWFVSNVNSLRVARPRLSDARGRENGMRARGPADVVLQLEAKRDALRAEIRELKCGVTSMRRAALQMEERCANARSEELRHERDGQLKPRT